MWSEAGHTFLFEKANMDLSSFPHSKSGKMEAGSNIILCSSDTMQTFVFRKIE